MKKTLLGLAMGAVALGIVAAGPAHADLSSSRYGGGYFGDQNAYAYAVQLDEYGTGYDAAQALDFGLTMCRTLRDGVPESQVISSGAATGIPYWQAELAIHGAEFHFCTDQY